MYFATTLNIDSVVDQFQGIVGDMENQINAYLEVMNSTETPGPQDIAAIQYMMSIYTSMMQEESSLIKNFGDIMKSIANNIGQ